MRSVFFYGKKFILLFLILSTFLLSQENEKKQVYISEWLYAGNIQVQLPVYHHEAGVKGQPFQYSDLLDFNQIDVTAVSPKAGEYLPVNNLSLKWEIVKSGKSNIFEIPNQKTEKAQIAYLAAYVKVEQWTTATLTIKTNNLLELYIDGELKNSKMATNKTDSEDNAITQPLKLETGKHLLLLKLLKGPSNDLSWNVCAKLESENKKQLSITTTHQQFINLNHILHSDVPNKVSISPDGEIAAVAISNSIISPDDKENWLELRNVKTGELLETYRGGTTISGISWAPKGQQFSYTTYEKSCATVWLKNLKSGKTELLLKNVKNFGSYTWSPDASFIIYSVSEDPEPEKSGVHRLDGMADRFPWSKSRSYLYKLNLKDKSKIRLTAGSLSTYLNDISSDGHKILFTKSKPDYTTRDYSETGLYIMDLTTRKVDSLWSGQWYSFAQFSPDGRKLLIIGGPSMFGKIGVNVPDGRIPNDYDAQAYIYEISSGEIEPITKNFDPEIQDAFWSKIENAIYFNVTDKSNKNLYRYNLKTKKYKRMNTGVEVLNDVTFALDKSVAVCYGSSADAPLKAYAIDLKKNKSKELVYPAKKDFANVEISDVKRWTFKNKTGDIVEGRVHYPPEFDPNKKYPAIVYYYAGTSPVTRDFGGRYPKNYWAANGYVVYILQPSGATGFGQEFSSRHVNDWGLTTVDEIILGTKEFLKAHPFVDEKRVGCMGASYGGFITMLLTTKTDIFAAAVSHAGISSLASYWGEGYWGYTYSAVATANSFPWNKKDFYVEQGALYNADKINTPMLLLHGMADTNVPPGESIQLYTALKLLGKDVEFVQVEGQNHWILEYAKRVKWSKSIIAYLDKYLKGQSAWWTEMYGE